MGIQMNIKSAEVVALAHEVAELRGISLTQALHDALKTEQRALTAKDRKAKMADFLAESRRLNAGRQHEADPFAFLYDELGLPN